MATKAERAKAEEQRKNHRRPPQPAPPRRRYQVDSSQPGVSASDRRAGGASTGMRNHGLGRGAFYAWEDTVAPLRPSRKQTRKSGNRQKTDTPLRAKQQLRVDTPGFRHDGKR